MTTYPKYPSGYYVYAYIRNKTSMNGEAGTPYYIGKGKGNRAWSKAHNVRLPPESWRIVVIAQDLSEIGAWAFERRMIRIWGRLDLGTGCLYNRTDGGEGASGYRHTQDTKIIISQKGTGKERSNETKVRISNAKTGKKRDPETVYRIAQTRVGRKWFNNGITQEYLFDCPEGWVRGRLTKPKRDLSKPVKPRTKCSPESNTKRSQTLKGKPKSDSHAQNISKGRKGIKFSEEHLQNLKASRQARAQREALQRAASKST